MHDNPGMTRLLNQRLPPFARLLGIEFISASPEGVVAEMLIREDLCTVFGTIHGGALMSFADTLGACATVVNLKPGQTTTTMESKTNFFARAPMGTKIRGESLPFHRGRTTMVWQTRITSQDGKLIGVVTQTQMVLDPKPST